MKMLSNPNNYRHVFLFFLFFTLTVSSQSFNEEDLINFTSTFNGTIEWGDMDNDGDLDVLVTGNTESVLPNPFTGIYLNKGIGSFELHSQTIIPHLLNSSASLGDINNDGYLDIIISGLTNKNASSAVTRIFLNSKGTSFNQLSVSGMAGIALGTTNWVDFNNDGKLDILLTGNSNLAKPITKIYENKGNNTFSEISHTLPDVFQSAVAIADFDNDGFKDILISGENGSNRVTSIFRNNGDFIFTNEKDFIGVSQGSLACGDIDNDGDVDILLTGTTDGNATNVQTKIFDNLRNFKFDELTDFVLPGIYQGNAAFADCDNDGYIDIILSGSNYKNDPITLLYNNKQDKTFTLNENTNFSGIHNGTVAWADIDNDDKNDFIISGINNSLTPKSITTIYFNLNTGINTTPEKISKIENPQFASNTVVLSWTSTTDRQTPYKGLTYNIQLGTSSGKSNIINPPATYSNGNLKTVSFGSFQNTFCVLKNLPISKFYWSVQAVDNGFKGSEFSDEQVFSTQKQSSNVIKVDSTISSINLQWQNGNGTKRVVFAKQSDVGKFSPVQRFTYIYNSNFGTSEDLGNGWYCVYNGGSNTVTVTGLERFTDYVFHVIEYNGTAGSENYFDETGENNPMKIPTIQNFQALPPTFPGVINGNITWGDYDNDGFLDILMTGTTDSTAVGAITKIYRNNGSGNFEEQTGIVLKELYNSSASWFDADNDGDLDIAMSGRSSSGVTTVIYINNGKGEFVELVNHNITGVEFGTLLCRDFDNNGKVDILITGKTEMNTTVTQLYKNIGNYHFSLQQSSIQGLAYGSMDCGDYDNDGDLDVFICGTSSPTANLVESPARSLLFYNNGNGVFSLINKTDFVGVIRSSCKFGDFNNDGYLDILYAGTFSDSEKDAFAYLYKNDGDGSFTSKKLNVGIVDGTVNWGDFNNDGRLDIFTSGNSRSNTPLALVLYNTGEETFQSSPDFNFVGLKNSSSAIADYDNNGFLDVLYTGTPDIAKNSKTFLYNLYNLNTNEAPESIINLNSSVNNANVTLKWERTTDKITPPEALTYNVWVAQVEKGNDVVSSLANNTWGKRIVSSFGSIQTDSIRIKNLKVGNYFWGVQAIDQSFVGGEFQEMKSFEIKVNVKASNLIVKKNESTSLTLQWDRGNGDSCVVFIKEGIVGKFLPEDRFTYSSDNRYGKTNYNNWSCVYNGSGNEVVITNLQTATNYVVQVFEYVGGVGSETYVDTNDKLIVKTTSFKEVVPSLMGVLNGSIEWGDYNNDKKLDYIITGVRYVNSKPDTITKLFKNVGGFTFQEQTSIVFPYIANGKAVWVDYDNDGDLDIFISGERGTASVSGL